MPGTTTRLNGYGVDAKDANKYEALAFMYAPEGASEPRRVTLDYLVDYCGIRGKEIPGELTASWRPRAGAPRSPRPRRSGRNGTSAASCRARRRRATTPTAGPTESWLSRIEDEAVVHGRYFAVLRSCPAVNCDVPLESSKRMPTGWCPSSTSLATSRATDSGLRRRLRALRLRV